MVNLAGKSVDEIVAALAVGDKERSRLLMEMLVAALEAVEPGAAVARALVDDDLEGKPITIVALGKAAPAMARAAGTLLEGRVRGGIVVSNHVAPVPGGLELLVTSHPIPDQSSIDAGKRLLELVAAVPAASRVLFLVSGGGSALAEAPAGGIGLDDLVTVSAALARAGIPIEDMNTVRTHLSAIKGGRLAAASAAPSTTILVSDVPASAPHLIASGPTVPCPTRPGDALDILARHHLTDRLPDRVVRALAAAPAPPAVNGNHVVAADAVMAARAGVAAAERAGAAATVSSVALCGPARDMVREALAVAERGSITIFAGETTVEVTGTGIGGRNQEAALVAAFTPPSGMFVTFGTDGIDGPTDAAGAVIDGATLDRITAAGIDPAAALESNDSHPALDAAGALIRCGPTGTNVADLWMVDRR